MGFNSGFKGLKAQLSVQIPTGLKLEVLYSVHSVKFREFYGSHNKQEPFL